MLGICYNAEMTNYKIQKLKTKQRLSVIPHLMRDPFSWIPAFAGMTLTCLALLMSSIPASAQTDIASGHTLQSSDGQARIIIPPNANRVAFVDLAASADYPALPLDKTLASNVYNYYLLPASDNRLEYPITLATRFQDAARGFKEIFIYDGAAAKWKHLTGAIDLDKNELTAQTTLASGYIAVLADKVDRSEYLKEELNSPTILVADAQSGDILVEQNSAIARPIASLTKIMAAAVFLDNNPGWKKLITMQRVDDTIPAKIYVKPGDKISTRDLFFATLVHSANNAAKALARSTGLTSAQFVRQMNAKAQTLGMASTKFVEPTGLAAGNISTAEDYLKLSQAMLKDPIFLQATTLKKYTLNVVRGKTTLKMAVANSNKILNSPFTITGSKTGYTTEAGRCLMIRAKNKDNREVIAIIMGATVPGKQWSDMNSLLAAALDEKTNYSLTAK